MDKKAVFISGAYPKQRILRKLAQKRDLARILNESDDIKKKLKIDLRLVNRTESTMVKEFLQRLDVLPYDHVIREGFVRQFLRFVAQKAFAFITYIQHMGNNGAVDSKAGVDVSKARKALDLSEEGTFGAVLAMAERMKPALSEYLATV